MNERVLISLVKVNGKFHRESMTLGEAKRLAKKLEMIGDDAEVESMSIAQLHLLEFLANRRVTLKPTRVTMPYRWRQA